MRLSQDSRVKERDNKMTFPHTLLSGILEDEEGKPAVAMWHQEGWETANGTSEHDSKKACLDQFMDEIRKAIRGVRFSYRFKVASRYEQWVYMPGEPYPMGYIGFGDYRQTTSGEAKFIVYSRKIGNVKYAVYSDQHHMKMSTNLDTAVRTAKKFLSNYSSIEMAEIDRETVHSEIRQTLELLDTEVVIAASDIGLSPNVPSGDPQTKRDALLNELRHLLNTGYEFIDVGYGAKLRTMFESMEELDTHPARNKQVNMYFVRGYARFGKQSFDVVPIDEINRYGGKVREEVTRYTDDLPEDIMGRVAVL